MNIKHQVAGDAPLVSIILPSRRKSNPNCRLNELVKSLIANTADLRRVELLVGIDFDDEIGFYEDILDKKRFYEELAKPAHTLSIQFVIGKRLGYENLHIAYDALATHSRGRIIQSITDDCVMAKKNWDETYAGIIAQAKEPLYFINCVREDALSYDSERAPFMQELWNKGSPTFFPSMTRELFTIVRSAGIKHGGTWGGFGNEYMIDNFYETLRYYLYQHTKQRHFYPAYGTIYQQADLAIAEHKEGGLWGQSPVSQRVFRRFVEPSTQDVLMEMAKAIADAMKA